jgi:hypothetical protein
LLAGFVTKEGQVWGRLVGVVIAKDGSMFFTDDGSRSVWHVSYIGRSTSSCPTGFLNRPYLCSDSQARLRCPDQWRLNVKVRQFPLDLELDRLKVLDLKFPARR